MEVRHPAVVKTAEQAIEHAIEYYELEEKLDPSRLASLRVSSFPFCGTQWLLNFPSASSGKRSNKFMGSFFTSVGTTVHSGIQAILDKSPFLIQDWKCFACGNLHKFVLRPRRCKKCKSLSLAGREHEYKVYPIVGHLDGAVLLKNGKICIIDYKTTSMRKLESHVSLLPGLDNVRQIEAYAALLKQQGYDIDGWTLIYIARNNGKRIYKSSTAYYGHTFEEEYPKILKRIERYKKDFIAVSEAKSLGDVAPVVARRRLRPDKEDTAELCRYCKFKPVCMEKSGSMLTDRLNKTIKILLVKRLPGKPNA